MRWPWTRSRAGDVLVVSWVAQTLCYVAARQRADGSHEILTMGVERQGADSLEAFVRRLQALGLKGRVAHVMLRPEQYQLLQIDAPAVPAQELRSAARYQIREMLDAHVDDVTLDVMRVGDGQQKGAGSLFVVAATNAVVRSVLEFCALLQWEVSIIDIQETAQRNLQTALAARDGRADRAHAALVLAPGHQAVLSISAHGELFYARRLDVSQQFLEESWGQGVQAALAPIDAYTPVEEYVPDYGGGDEAYAAGAAEALLQPATRQGAGEAEPAQRFLVEVQRSLDVWDRTWSGLPLASVAVYAGQRSRELASWLGQQLGQAVVPMELDALFPGLAATRAQDQALCVPLLGVLLRSDERAL